MRPVSCHVSHAMRSARGRLRQLALLVNLATEHLEILLQDSVGRRAEGAAVSPGYGPPRKMTLFGSSNIVKNRAVLGYFL